MPFLAYRIMMLLMVVASLGGCKLVDEFPPAIKFNGGTPSQSAVYEGVRNSVYECALRERNSGVQNFFRDSHYYVHWYLWLQRDGSVTKIKKREDSAGHHHPLLSSCLNQITDRLEKHRFSTAEGRNGSVQFGFHFKIRSIFSQFDFWSLFNFIMSLVGLLAGFSFMSSTWGLSREPRLGDEVKNDSLTHFLRNGQAHLYETSKQAGSSRNTNYVASFLTEFEGHSYYGYARTNSSQTSRAIVDTFLEALH